MSSTYEDEFTVVCTFTADEKGDTLLRWWNDEVDEGDWLISELAWKNNYCAFYLIDCRSQRPQFTSLKTLSLTYATCAATLELPVEEGSEVPLFEFAVAEVVLWRATWEDSILFGDGESWPL